MLPQVAKSFPDLYPHVFQMYSGFSPLLFQKGEESYLLSSQEGVHQGNPLGPILFSLTIHPLLVDLQKSHPLIHTLAYLDDVFLVGPLDGVLSAFNDLRGSTSQVGLSIATNKCEIFGTGKSEYKSSEPICISFVGTTVLGTPVGRPDYIESYCSDTTLGGQTLCTQILALNNPQCGMLLLRSCHVPRLNYLMRTVAPSLIMSATTVHDNLTRSTFQQLIKCPELNDDQWLQATLPTHFGGFGMLSAQSTSSIAFVSSWAGSLATLPQCFNDLQSLTVNVMNSTKDAAAGSIGHELQLSLPVNKSLEDLVRNPKKLQHKLCQDFFTTAVSSIQENSNTPRQTARFRSLQGKGAGAWLQSVPTSSKFALKHGDFCLASRLRLGCDMLLASAFDKCNCGQPNDREGYHLLTCKHGGGPIWTHGTIVSVWSDCLRNLSITHRTEPRELYDGNQCRPDIVYFDAQTGCDIEMDISIAHPWNGDVISNASREDGAAAVRREQQKAMKYSHQFDIFGNPSNCIPVVF